MLGENQSGKNRASRDARNIRRGKCAHRRDRKTRFRALRGDMIFIRDTASRVFCAFSAARMKFPRIDRCGCSVHRDFQSKTAVGIAPIHRKSAIFAQANFQLIPTKN